MKREVIERLYEVFAPYKDSLMMAQQIGNSSRVRSLTVADFDIMASRFDISVALYQLEILRHFLPRIIELNDWNSPSTPSWFNLESKLKYGKWRDWPTVEVAALRAVWWEWALGAIIAGGVKDFIVYFLREINEELDKYLDLWLYERPFEIADFLMHCDWNDENNSVVQWAKKPQVVTHLEIVFYQNPDSKGAELLSNVVQLLQNLRAF